MHKKYVLYSSTIIKTRRELFSSQIGLSQDELVALFNYLAQREGSLVPLGPVSGPKKQRLRPFSLRSSRGPPSFAGARVRSLFGILNRRTFQRREKPKSIVVLPTDKENARSHQLTEGGLSAVASVHSTLNQTANI